MRYSRRQRRRSGTSSSNAACVLRWLGTAGSISGRSGGEELLSGTAGKSFGRGRRRRVLVRREAEEGERGGGEGGRWSPRRLGARGSALGFVAGVEGNGGAVDRVEGGDERCLEAVPMVTSRWQSVVN